MSEHPTTSHDSPAAQRDGEWNKGFSAGCDGEHHVPPVGCTCPWSWMSGYAEGVATRHARLVIELTRPGSEWRKNHA